MEAKDRARLAKERGPIAQLELSDEDRDAYPAAERGSLMKKVAFLRAFALRGIVLDGVIASGVARTSVRYWIEHDEWFADLYDAAQEEAADRIEAEVHRRAVEGVDEPVIFQGLPTQLTDKETGETKVLTIKKYSDSLLTLLAKGARREKFSERVDNKHTFDGQAGVLVVPAAPDPKAWAEAVAAQQAKYAGNTGEEK